MGPAWPAGRLVSEYEPPGRLCFDGTASDHGLYAGKRFLGIMLLLVLISGRGSWAVTAAALDSPPVKTACPQVDRFQKAVCPETRADTNNSVCPQPASLGRQTQLS